MDAHTLIEEWEVSPFEGGLEGVRDLQARGFSGAVEAGGTVLFLRDGDPLAVVADLAGDPRPGDVDALEGAVGDLHTARRSETATLAAMLALDGDVRGQYFTEDTPLSTVHETLSGGGFTGYVELSENVLSGDYYVVYRDGREEYIAFVGSSNRVLVDEEARTKVEAEVGIYSVVGVALPGVAVPRDDGPANAAPADREGSTTGVAPDPASAGDATVDTATETSVPGAASDTATEHATPETATAGGTSDEGTGEADTGVESVSNPENASGESEQADQATGVGTDTVAAESGTTGSGTTESPRDSTDATAETDDAAPAGPPGTSEQIKDGNSEVADVSGPSGEAPAEPTGGPLAEAGDDPPSATESDTGETTSAGDTGESTAGGDTGETIAGGEGSVVDAVSSRTVPSLDPQNSRPVRVDDASEGDSLPVDAESDPESTSVPETPADHAEDSSEPGAVEAAEPSEQPSELAAGPDVERRVEAVRREYEGRLQELRTEIDELRAERDDLRGRIESLQSGPEGADGPGGPGDGTRSLSPSEAIAGTSLFVREGTRGGATLEDALDGGADRETLAENVRVEYHTEFDDDGVTVDGQPFEAWLHGTAHYRFVRWAVVDLLFEIRTTGAASSMRPLYEALPAVDRVGLRDAVSVGEDDAGREITFDVVARNQMGDPLFVATIDESRDPTSGSAIEPLVTDASDLCASTGSLVGTFAVTSSYFEPAALDTVREATSGSLLGRDRYRSYVKLARTNGFHMCMVERRNGDFHLTVPEL